MADMNKKILILQHLAIEHPGIFRDFFNADSFSVDTIHLDQGESIPDLRDYDALWVMGGPMDVWEEQKYPWLRSEKSAIRAAIRNFNIPFVGICLGHQLLADALGGEVSMSKEPEVGMMNVELTSQGKLDPHLLGLPDPLKCFQWHSASITRVPEQLNVLASSQVCPIQALGNGHSVISIQFHIEITRDTVSEWYSVPAYQASLDKTLGQGSISDLKKAVDDNLEGLNNLARQFYQNWRKQAFGF